MRVALILFSLLFPTLVFGQSAVIRPDVIETIYSAKNYVRNPSAFKNIAGVTTSSASITRDASTNKIDGVASFSCDTSALNGYCLWLTNTINDPDKTGNCEARMTYKGDASLLSLLVTDGTNTLNSVALTNETDWKEASVYYPCGSTRDVRLAQTTAGTTTAVAVGRVYYGKVTALGPVAQPEPMLYAERTTTQSVTAITETTVTATAESFDPYNAFGSGVFTVPRKGTYVLNFTIQLGNATTTEQFFFRWRYNSTTYTPCFEVRNPSAGSETVSVTCSYPANAGDTFRATVQSTADTAYDVTLGRWSITFVPDASQVGIRSQDSNYDWTAYTPTFTGFGTVTSPECFHKRDAGDLLLRCKGTTGTTTATEARVSLPGSLVNAGTDRIPSIVKVGDFARGISAASQFSFHVLAEPNVSYVTFSVQGNSVGGLTKVNGNGILGTGETFSFTARVPIAGWSENQKAPLLLGSVTSGLSGMLRIETATLSSTCAISGGTSANNWLTSATNPATGRCSATMTGFSSQPSCQVMAITGSAGDIGCKLFTGFATGTLVYQCTQNGTDFATGTAVTCVGTR